MSALHCPPLFLIINERRLPAFSERWVLSTSPCVCLSKGRYPEARGGTDEGPLAFRVGAVLFFAVFFFCFLFFCFFVFLFFFLFFLRLGFSSRVFALVVAGE